MKVVTESPCLVAGEVAAGLLHHESVAAREIAIGTPPDTRGALADCPVPAQVLDVREVDLGRGGAVALLDRFGGDVAHGHSVTVVVPARDHWRMHTLLKALRDAAGILAAMLGLMIVIAVTFALMLLLLSHSVLT